MLDEQSSVNISCFKDEDWDEYGVNDALQHNLLADGTDELHSMAVSSDWQSKLPSQPSWDTDNPSIEGPSSSSSPSRTLTNSEPAQIQPTVNTWITTVDNNYYSLPFDFSEQSYELSTSSSALKRSLQSPQPRPAANIKRNKRITDSSTSHVSITIPPDHSGSEDMRSSSLFPCPFYHHDPAKYSTQQWRSCMGPGWTIHRLKEHIYRRHCLPEHACQRCLAEFNSQSELADHERYPRCPVLSDSASGKIGKSKKVRIRTRRAKMPDYEKWVVIYRILFDSDPVRASPSNTQSSESSQPTESPETLTSFEHYLRTRKGLDGSESVSEQVQTCLNLIREWREEQNAPRSRQASRDLSTVPHGGFALLDASQVSQNEAASWPGVGNEGGSLDWYLMEELYNNDISDQWLLDSFSYEPPGDVSWDFI